MSHTTLDLGLFPSDEAAIFTVKGTATIHLTGSMELVEDDEDEEDDDSEEGDGEMVEFDEDGEMLSGEEESEGSEVLRIHLLTSLRIILTSR